MQRAYYESSLQDFLQQDENLILGILARNNEYTLEDLQRNAWLAEIRICLLYTSPSPRDCS